jgi:hypothetical protein
VLVETGLDASTDTKSGPVHWDDRHQWAPTEDSVALLVLTDTERDEAEQQFVRDRRESPRHSNRRSRCGRRSTKVTLATTRSRSGRSLQATQEHLTCWNSSAPMARIEPSAPELATGTGLPGPFQEDDGLATMPVKRTVPVVRSRSA